MNKTDLFLEARQNFPTAVDLAIAVLLEEFNFSIADILECYAIVVDWESRLKPDDQEICIFMEKVIINCKKEMNTYKEEFERDLLPNYESEIRDYLEKEQNDSSSENLAVLQIFLAMAEKNPYFRNKDWSCFLRK